MRGFLGTIDQNRTASEQEFTVCPVGEANVNLLSQIIVSCVGRKGNGGSLDVGRSRS